MSSRLLMASLAAVLLSLNCFARSPVAEKITVPAPIVAGDAAFEEEETTPITCGAAFRIAEQHGYRNVEVQTCFGTEYAFRALQDGRDVIVLVDPLNGRVWQGKVLR